MKIVVTEFKKLSPFISLFSPVNKDAKQALSLLQKQYFDNSDLYQMQKLGVKIIKKKTHTN